MKSRQNRILIFHTHTFFLHCQPDISGRTSDPDLVLIYTSRYRNHNLCLFSCFQRHFLKSFQFLKRLIFSSGPSAPDTPEQSLFQKQFPYFLLYRKFPSSRLFALLLHPNTQMLYRKDRVRNKTAVLSQRYHYSDSLQTHLPYNAQIFLPEILRWRVQNSLYVSYKRSPAVFRTD